MTDVLVVAEHRGGALQDVTGELVTAALELREQGGGGTVSLAIVSHDPSSLADAASFEGVDRLVEVQTPEDAVLVEVSRVALERLVEELRPTVVLLGYTVDAMTFAPAVAARHGLGFASDVVACSVGDRRVLARRGYYGGKVEAELEFPGKEPVILLLRPTAWEHAARGRPPDRMGVELRDFADSGRMRHLRSIEAPTGAVDITRAEVILAIGRGIGERTNIEQFERLAERMGATLAASRPLVDAGWMPPERQVGQSGKTVKPKVYVAMGISGAVQHIAGMKRSGTIVAVNTDADAPIFQVADYGAVADIFDVADELEGILGS